MRHLPINHGADGGPWCPACGHWTEVNADREMANVCVRCGRPGVVMKPPSWATKVRATHGGKVLNATEVHALFEEMRRLVNGSPNAD